MAAEVKRCIQFLVCPQRDFIDKIGPSGEKPNKLHVGPEAALKLRGDESQHQPDYFVETVLRFYNPEIQGSERARRVIRLMRTWTHGWP